MIKAIFFDVDGTLLSHRTKQIPQDTKRVLRELQKKWNKNIYGDRQTFHRIIKITGKWYRV